MRIHLHHQPKRTKSQGIVSYYSLASSFVDKDGKRQKKIVKRLGRLSDEQAQAYRALLMKVNSPTEILGIQTLDAVSIVGEQRYLDVLVLNELWLQLKLDRLFSSNLKPRQKLSTEQIARILTLNKLLKPKSKVKTIPWFHSTMLDVIMNVDKNAYKKTKIFDELSAIHRSQPAIERAFIGYSQSLRKKDPLAGEVEVYYFDGTTSWFEGEECSLARFDIEKTRGFYPKIIGLMMVTDKRGFPLAWEVVNGNTKDTTQLKPMIKRLREQYGVRQITYCFDRGVASEANFEAIDLTQDSKFISGIRDNQIHNVFDLEDFQATRKKMLEAWENAQEDRRSSSKKRYIAGIDGFHASSDRLSYFKDLGVLATDRLRYITAFNIVFYQKEQKARHERIKKALFAIDELNRELSHAKRDRDFNATERELLSILAKHKVRNFFDYRLLPHNTRQGIQTFKIEQEPKMEAVIKAAQTDGLMVYVSNHTETTLATNSFAVHARDIVEHYKSKYRIESFFRELKSVVELRPFHVWKEEHVKAHYDIAVIACFINNYINESLKRLPLESEMSFNEFYDELENSAGAVHLMATNGHQITKAKPISKQLAQAFAAMGIAPLLLPTKHAAHGVYH